ncbi:MAG: hypothetical protein RBT20_10310, partial [Syntrophales bacterium]|nr:hypothetical protein [Syntrophales bacterium]
DKKAGIELDRTKTTARADFPLKEFLVVLAAGFGIYAGADYTVKSLVDIAHFLRVAPSIVSLTVLSLGTTSPELVVSLTAVKQGKPQIAVGNVLGSCVFNALVIPGGVSALGTISVPENLIGFSLPLFVVASVFFYLLTQDKKISKWEGLLFLVFYGFFLSKAIAAFL